MKGKDEYLKESINIKRNFEKINKSLNEKKMLNELLWNNEHLNENRTVKEEKSNIYIKTKITKNSNI